MEGEEVGRFLAETVAFVEDAERVVAEALAEAGALTLRRHSNSETRSSARSRQCRTSSPARSGPTSASSYGRGARGGSVGSALDDA
jgi:hypothetical protein